MRTNADDNSSRCCAQTQAAHNTQVVRRCGTDDRSVRAISERNEWVFSVILFFVWVAFFAQLFWCTEPYKRTVMIISQVDYAQRTLK